MYVLSRIDARRGTKTYIENCELPAKSGRIYVSRPCPLRIATTVYAGTHKRIRSTYRFDRKIDFERK